MHAFSLTKLVKRYYQRGQTTYAVHPWPYVNLSLAPNYQHKIAYGAQMFQYGVVQPGTLQYLHVILLDQLRSIPNQEGRLVLSICHPKPSCGVVSRRVAKDLAIVLCSSSWLGAPESCLMEDFYKSSNQARLDPSATPLITNLLPTYLPTLAPVYRQLHPSDTMVIAMTSEIDQVQ